VPAGVRDVIRQRLDRVSPETRSLLEVLAVGGDEVRPALAAEAAGREPAWVRARVDEAVRAGVLAERGGRLRFSHALMREVLYRDLDADARRALHAAFGAAIERLSAAAADAPLMELAHHAIEGPAAALGRAVELAEGAARRALDVVAHEEAVDVLSRALTAVGEAGAEPSWRARLLLALGEARIRAGASAAGQALCLEAAALARGLNDPELMARVALAYGRVFTFGEVDLVLVGLLEAALEALPPGDSAPRARLLARLGGALQPAPKTDEPVRVAREAIATARRLGQRRVLLETMFDGMSALMDVVDPRERLALNFELEGLAVAEGDRERLLRTHLRLAIDHLALGQLELADARIDALDELARALRAGYALWRAPLLRALRAMMHGRFAESERLIAQAAALAEELQDPQRERAVVLMREGLYRAAERHDDMLAHEGVVRRQRASYRNGIAWQALGSALTFARMEDVERARAELALIPAELMPPADNVFAIFSAAESVAFVGSDELVARFAELLAPFTEEYAMLGMTALQWEGPVPRLLALLEARLGRWAEAEAHFVEAAARARRLEARPQLARIQYEHGRALVSRGRPEDLARGRQLLEAARALADELGMTGLGRLAGARLAGVAARPEAAAPPPAPAAAPVPLTLVLEGEFWTLTAAGCSALRLKDSLGLRYLSKLVAEPGREIHVLELVGGGAGADADGAVADAGDAGELLDDEARAQYRQRLEDLREDVAEAEAFGDAARASRARAEIEALAAELGRAVGLGGRARRAGSAAERARSAVQRRIKNALQRIGEGSADLESRLSKAVRTGNYCVFRPEAF
jgi:tetratricopeptide (TPR) repeat protein